METLVVSSSSLTCLIDLLVKLKVSVACQPSKMERFPIIVNGWKLSEQDSEEDHWHP